MVSASSTSARSQCLVGPAVKDCTSKPRVFAPKRWLNVFVAPPVMQACPLVYSGYGGVVPHDAHMASGAVAGLPSVSASWIAVTGRQYA
jgi:hypothetical protein